jgi:hypothetical protein
VGAVGGGEVWDTSDRAQHARFGMGDRFPVRFPMVRARREMSLVAVSRFFRFAIQMNFPGCSSTHGSPPQGAAG